jgi:hypothetical protein
MNSLDELIQAFAMMQLVVEEVREYRLHYDSGGMTFGSMSNHPANTTYVVVTEYEYENCFRYEIYNSKLRKIDNNPGTRVRLSISTAGYAVVKTHANLLLEPTDTCAEIAYYADN